MKSLMMTLILISGFSVSAAECQQQEAQFIGTVVNLTDYRDDYAQIGECSFQIEITPERYQPSLVEGCGLDYDEVLRNWFSYDYFHTDGLNSCPAAYNGQEISGYLVKKDGKISIE